MNRIKGTGCISIAGVFLRLAIISTLIGGPVSAAATDLMIAKVKVTHRAVKSETFPAPDETGHVLAVGTREGEAVFDNGDTAHYRNTAMVDGWIGKHGFYKGYTGMSFKDGSEIFFSWEATGNRTEDNISVTQGTGIIIRGTGRFTGIRGNVFFRTIPSKPAGQNANGTAVSNAVIVYTLP